MVPILRTHVIVKPFLIQRSRLSCSRGPGRFRSSCASGRRRRGCPGHPSPSSDKRTKTQDLGPPGGRVDAVTCGNSPLPSGRGLSGVLRVGDPQNGKLNRDFPDGLRPTTAVGLSDDSIADRKISKHSLRSAEGVSGRCQAMMQPKTPCLGAFIGDPRRPSPSPGSACIMARERSDASLPEPGRRLLTPTIVIESSERPTAVAGRNPSGRSWREPKGGRGSRATWPTLSSSDDKHEGTTRTWLKENAGTARLQRKSRKRRSYLFSRLQRLNR